ncbi:DUF202 domain-containing protein [Aestuariibaculum sp. YM273]|uniref:DUF202 domain-containing protein n=1 Tax=Aestuariibaculum sp. YM273 TaxID=3070659 RepID=UPI0027DE7FF8|nr:DUF202 domain-containing protein [Aestuariibaculum sp. YM273]WMI64378.1 DUF202 domain-containing protein [Aestuariibaculum sp. YM273]
MKRKKLIPRSHEFKPDERIILRDQLAIERTRLANERTLLSYIRSSLYMLIGSFALFQIKDYPNFKYLAFAALVFSVVFLIIGVYRFYILKRSLKRLFYLSEYLDDKSA